MIGGEVRPSATGGGAYTEALEQHVGAVRMCSTPGAVEQMASNWPDGGQRILAFWPNFLWGLCRAETLHVAADIAGLLGHVARRDPPTWTVNPQDLLAERGFCWFASNPDYHDAEDPDAELVALSWDLQWASDVVRTGGRLQTAFSVDGPAPDALRADRVLFLYPWYGAVHAPRRMASFPWSPVVARVGTPIHHVARTGPVGQQWTPTQLADMTFLGALFATLMLFVQQRVLTAPGRVAERHARKRVEAQGWTQEPVVRVIELRRRTAPPHPASETTGGAVPVEWSCRWLVRGHWRQQYFPGTGEHKPLWILPHIKGPDEKPLKPSRASLYAVVR